MRLGRSCQTIVAVMAASATEEALSVSTPPIAHPPTARMRSWPPDGVPGAGLLAIGFYVASRCQAPSVLHRFDIRSTNAALPLTAGNHASPGCVRVADPARGFYPSMHARAQLPETIRLDPDTRRRHLLWDGHR